MRTTSIRACVILALITISISYSAPPTERVSIAVLELVPKGIGVDEASILTDKLREQLLNTGTFNVLERSAMDAVLKEQGFQQTGCTSTDCAVEVGQLVGVRYIVAGSIGKLEDLFLITVRLIDVQTGAIFRSASEESRGSLTVLFKQALPAVATKLAGTTGQSPVIETQPTPPQTDTLFAETTPPPPRIQLSGPGIRFELNIGGCFAMRNQLIELYGVREVQPTPGMYMPLSGYMNTTSGNGGFQLGAGVLLKRNYLGIEIGFMKGGAVFESLYYNNNPLEFSVERDQWNACLVWFYEPLAFRSWAFGISPGIRAGYWRIEDRVTLQNATDYEHRGIDMGILAPSLKLRFGRRRVVTSLEYCYVIGGTPRFDQERFQKPDDGRVYEYIVSYQGSPMHYATFTIHFITGGKTYGVKKSGT